MGRTGWLVLHLAQKGAPNHNELAERGQRHALPQVASQASFAAAADSRSAPAHLLPQHTCKHSIGKQTGMAPHSCHAALTCILDGVSADHQLLQGGVLRQAARQAGGARLADALTNQAERGQQQGYICETRCMWRGSSCWGEVETASGWSRYQRCQAVCRGGEAACEQRPSRSPCSHNPGG